MNVDIFKFVHFKSVLGGILSVIPESKTFDAVPVESNAIVHAMLNIMNRFYTKHTSTIFITEQSLSLALKSGSKPLEIAGELIRIASQQAAVTYVIDNNVIFAHRRYNRLFNIFFIDSYESFRWANGLEFDLAGILIKVFSNFNLFFSFRNIFVDMTSENFDFAGFYTIVLTEHNENRQEIIRKIFQDCWSLYITNANLLIPTEDYETILLFTYFPFTSEQCEGVEPVIYDFFENNTFLANAPIFPDKFRNFHKCPLKISTYNFAPFMILEPQPNGSYFIDGIEGTMFRFMSQRLNFTPVIVPSTTNILRKITNSSNTEIPNSTLRRSLDVVKKNGI